MQQTQTPNHRWGLKLESTPEPVGSTLLFESEACRVWLLALLPGQSSNWHEHLCDYVYIVIRAGAVYTENEDGTKDHQYDNLGDSRYHQKCRRHRLVNAGETRYENIIVELKKT